MKIYSKGSYCFGPGYKRDGTIEKFVTSPNTFHDMPDKFSDDPLFKDCVKFGLVEIVGAQPQPVSLENAFDETPEAELAEFVAQVKAMGHDELVSSAEEAGISLTGNEKDKEIRKALATAKKKGLGL